MLGQIARQALHTRITGLAVRTALLSFFLILLYTKASSPDQPLSFGWIAGASSVLFLHLVAMAGCVHGMQCLNARGRLPFPLWLSRTCTLFGSIAIAILGSSPYLLHQGFPFFVTFGQTLNRLLPVSQLLLWKDYPTAWPVRALIFTLGLTVLALPAFLHIAKALFCKREIQLDPFPGKLSDFAEGDCRSAIETVSRQQADAPSHGTDQTTGTAWRVPQVPPRQSMDALRHHAATLREQLNHPNLDPGRFLLPEVLDWPWIFRLYRTRALWGLAALAAGLLSGTPIGILCGGIFLAGSMQIIPFGGRFGFAAFYGAPLAMHQWLPISLQPTWNRMAQDVNRNLLTALLFALPLAGAAWVITTLGLAVASHLPWYSPMAAVTANQLAAATLVAVLSLAWATRVFAPAFFVEKLLPRQVPIGYGKLGFFPIWLIFSLQTITMGLTVIYLIQNIFSDRSLLQPSSLLRITGVTLLTGELLRLLSLKLAFFLWAHSRKA